MWNFQGGFTGHNTIHGENNLMPPAVDNNFLALANRPRSSSVDEDASPPQSPPSRVTILRSANNLLSYTGGKDKELWTEQDYHHVNAKYVLFARMCFCRTWNVDHLYYYCCYRCTRSAFKEDCVFLLTQIIWRFQTLIYTSSNVFSETKFSDYWIQLFRTDSKAFDYCTRTF